MTETVSTAVAKRNGAEALIERYSNDFATVLPSHIKPATFVRLAQGVLRRNPQLQNAATKNPGSFLSALLEAARLGHEPGTEQYYLVPFGGEVQGIEGYRGVIERMYRAGAVASVKAEVVREGDEFAYDPGEMDRPVHKVDWFGDRGPIKGAYAYAVFKDGSTSKVVVINRQYIEQVKRESKSAGRPDSPWVKWEEAMVLKTVAHRLEPWVPTSSEYRREALRAVAEADNLRTPQPGVIRDMATGQGVDLRTGEVVDGEVVDPDADAYEQAAAEAAQGGEG